MRYKIIGLKFNINCWIYVDSVPSSYLLQKYTSPSAPTTISNGLTREFVLHSKTTVYQDNKKQEISEKILFAEQLLSNSSPSMEQITQLMESIQRELPNRIYMQFYLSDNHTAIFELHVLLSKIANNPKLLNKINILSFLNKLLVLNKNSKAFCFTFTIKRFAEIITIISPERKQSIDYSLKIFRASLKKGKL
ncbi:MAG: hypothetical protein PHF25_05375 [Candidatus Margulisbacteria bacterium]|nr:hypothetical protein [Candidatus Margulisiibacteriota bacterium]